MGSVDEIAGGILKEIPTPPKAEKKSGSSPMNIVLLAVGGVFALVRYQQNRRRIAMRRILDADDDRIIEFM